MNYAFKYSYKAVVLLKATAKQKHPAAAERFVATSP
jgi:hypothetical protein